MSIASEITRINNNIANAYDECETKGATMPQYENSTNLASTIASIPSGGGGADLSEYFNTTISSNTSASNYLSTSFLKKMPKLTISNEVSSLAYLFKEFPEEILDFDGDMDCTNITSFERAFYYSSTAKAKLETLDLSHFKNTQNITTISNMIYNSVKLTTILGSKEFFSMQNTVNCTGAFYEAQKLIKLDLSNFKPASGSKCNQMFYNNWSLAVLDISGLDTSNLTNYSNMFFSVGGGCLQSDGAYADGIPYIYVKDATAQNWVLTANNGHPNTWTTDNVVIKSN